jgi:two pore calcium channel protein
MNKLKVFLLFILACDMLVFMFSPGPFRIAPYIRVAFLIMTIRELRMCAVTLVGIVGTYLNVLVRFCSLTICYHISICTKLTPE